jgi:hypothetical protein
VTISKPQQVLRRYNPMMRKVAKRANELRSLILAEALRDPVCPPDIDVVVRPDPARGWRADTVSPNHIGYADCADHIGRIVQRLRRDYDLMDG